MPISKSPRAASPHTAANNITHTASSPRATLAIIQIDDGYELRSGNKKLGEFQSLHDAERVRDSLLSIL